MEDIATGMTDLLNNSHTLMSINDIKKIALKDWVNAFPDLTLFGKNKLYKILGPVILGLELIKLPHANEYRPHFVIYPLWKESLKKCLDVPIILDDYYNKKGFQYSIPYEKHNVYFEEVVDAIKTQTPVSFYGDIFFDDLTSILQKPNGRRPSNKVPHSYLYALNREDELKMNLFAGISDAQFILESMRNASWDESHFKKLGKDLNEWLTEMEQLVVTRDIFLQQIDTNAKDRKIAKLHHSNLIF